MAASLKAERALQLATRVVAVEILLACQAIDLLAPAADIAGARAGARARARRRPDACRRPSAVARHRADLKIDHSGIARTRVRDRSQVKIFSNHIDNARVRF
jgi:hypothetical protein